MQVSLNKGAGKYFAAILAAIVFWASFFSDEVKAAAGGAGNAGSETEVIVLNYHKIDNYNNPLSVSPAEFEQQMRYFKTYNYRVISMERLYDFLDKGDPLPEKSVVITFDDGYSDNYDHAYPILKKYGYPATIFVITSLVETPGYITWDQAAELNDNGVSIESHTVNHRTLSNMTDEKAGYEIKTSKEIIEKKLGKRVKYLAYPEGFYNRLTEKLVKEAGYRGALTIRYGTVDANSDLYALERIPIFHTQATIRDFMRRIHYRSNFAQTGWLK